MQTREKNRRRDSKLLIKKANIFRVHTLQRVGRVVMAQAVTAVGPLLILKISDNPFLKIEHIQPRFLKL